MSEQSHLVRPEPYDRLSGAHLAAAGFLARYSGRTRDAHAADLRTYLAWCTSRQLDPFEATRPHVEIYSRWLEEDRHLAPATVARRLSTVIGFYRFMVIDGRLDKSPAQYVRRPRVSADSQALGLDRMQLGTLVAVARGSGPMDAALITLLGLLGLRVSEACSVEPGGLRRRTRPPHLAHHRQRAANPPSSRYHHRWPGPWTWPPTSAPPDHSYSPGPDGGWTATPRPGSCTAWPRRPGSTTGSGCHSLRHSYITAALDAGVPLRDVQIAARHADPRTTTRYDRARGNLDRHANYVVAAFIAGAA